MTLESKIKAVLNYSQDLCECNIDDLMTNWTINKAYYVKHLCGDNFIYKSHEKMTFHLGREEKLKKIEQLIRYVEDYNYSLANFISKNKEDFFTNQLAHDFLVEETGEKIKKGMKITRAFKYFERNSQWLDMFQTYASRILQEDKITGYLCISVHPLDYLSSSENIHNWRSCHSLDGDYRSGNLAYMGDKSTVVCYISDDEEVKLPNFPESVKWNSKKWRMLLHFSEDYNAVFAGRQYPFFSRDIMNHVLGVLQDKMWGIKVSPWSNSEVSVAGAHAHAHHLQINGFIQPREKFITAKTDIFFNDLLDSNVYLRPYYAYKYPLCPELAKMPHWTIGEPVKCISCGKHYLCEDNREMVCFDCTSEDEVIYCANCGAKMYNDEGVVVKDGDIYVSVCECCANEHTICCDSCGERIFTDAAIRDEEGYTYCKDCI